jgi:hypothetical protein
MLQHNAHDAHVQIQSIRTAGQQSHLCSKAAGQQSHSSSEEHEAKGGATTSDLGSLQYASSDSSTACAHLGGFALALGGQTPVLQYTNTLALLGRYAEHQISGPWVRPDIGTHK